MALQLANAAQLTRTDQPVSPKLSGPSPVENKASPPNGSRRPISSRLPQPRRSGRHVKLLALLLAVAVIGSGGCVCYYVMTVGSVRTDLILYPVHFDRLELSIVERGALESAKNSDIICTVKAGTKGSTTATTIKWVIADGSRVKEGDPLVELDSSGLEEQLKTQKITLDSAHAAWIKAEEDYKITLSQNDSDISRADIDRDLSKLDLEKYKEGDYPQALKDVEGRITTAESDLEQWRDRAAWSERTADKGYVTPSQALSDRLKLQSAQIALAKVQEELRVLKDYTWKRTMTDLTRRHAETKKNLERVKHQARSREIQADSERATRKSIYAKEKTRHDEYVEEIKKCRILSPQDGMVVYYVSDQSRYGSGSQQSIIAQGEPVREGQNLMRIPDLARMLVNTKVHEAMVSHLKGNEPAHVRVDAYPERVLRGRVKAVATIASQQDWMSADVKVYQTLVAIEGDIEDLGLKPGMSAEVKIAVDGSLDHVLTVPVQAILGTPSMGHQRKCFVMTAEGPQQRDILVGMSNSKLAEIKEGLNEGDQIVLNPKVLLTEKDKLRPIAVDDKHSEEDTNASGAGKDGASEKKDKGHHAEGRPGARLDGKMVEPLEKGRGSPPGAAALPLAA